MFFYLVFFNPIKFLVFVSTYLCWQFLNGCWPSIILVWSLGDSHKRENSKTGYHTKSQGYKMVAQNIAPTMLVR